MSLLDDSDIGHVELESDINLVPILDALVTLIAFLLMASSSQTIGKIDTQFEGGSVGVVEQKDSGVKPARLEMTIMSDQVIFNHERIPLADTETLYAKAKEFKVKNPRTFKVHTQVASGVQYDKVVEVLSKVRALGGRDKFLEVNDAGKTVKLTLLFPDVVWSNKNAQ